MQVPFIYNNRNVNERKVLKAKVGQTLTGSATEMLTPTAFRVNVSHDDPQATDRGRRPGWPLHETVIVEWDEKLNAFNEVAGV